MINFLFEIWDVNHYAKGMHMPLYNNLVTKRQFIKCDIKDSAMWILAWALIA